MMERRKIEMEIEMGECVFVCVREKRLNFVHVIYH